MLETDLLESDLSSPLSEALTADHQTVSSDETGLVSADTTDCRQNRVR